MDTTTITKSFFFFLGLQNTLFLTSHLGLSRLDESVCVCVCARVFVSASMSLFACTVVLFTGHHPVCGVKFTARRASRRMREGGILLAKQDNDSFHPRPAWDCTLFSSLFCLSSRFAAHHWGGGSGEHLDRTFSAVSYGWKVLAQGVRAGVLGGFACHFFGHGTHLVGGAELERELGACKSWTRPGGLAKTDFCHISNQKQKGGGGCMHACFLQ